MTEVRPDSSIPDRETKTTTPKITQPLDGSTLPREYGTSVDRNTNPYLGNQDKLDADFDAGVIDRETYRQITKMNAAYVAPAAEVGSDHPESVTSVPSWDSTPASPIALSPEARENMKQKSEKEPRPPMPRRKFFGILGGAVAAAAGVGTVAYVANRPKQQVTTTPVDDESSDTNTSPSAPTTPEAQKTLESDQDAADKLIARDHTDFIDPEQTSRKDQQLAVDGVMAKEMLGGAETDPYIQLTFDKETGETIADKSPLAAAAKRAMDNKQRVANGQEPLERPTPQDILDDLGGAQAILDQVLFQYNNVFGQIVSADDREHLDQNKGANMISGLYYDPKGPEAKWLKETLVDNQTSIDHYGTKYRWIVQDDEGKGASDRVRTHDFYGNGEQLPYIVINFKNESKDTRHVVLTPVETTFTGQDPYGGLNDLMTFEITKWLIVAEGDGMENIDGKLSEK